jgi:predicted transcriptional regulator
MREGTEKLREENRKMREGTEKLRKASRKMMQLYSKTKDNTGSTENQFKDDFVSTLNNLATRTRKSIVEVLKDSVNLYNKAVTEWEDNKMGIAFQRLDDNLDDDFITRLDELARASGTSKSDVLRRAIGLYAQALKEAEKGRVIKFVPETMHGV